MEKEEKRLLSEEELIAAVGALSPEEIEKRLAEARKKFQEAEKLVED